MARAQTPCGRISCSERGTGFPLVLPYASLCDRRDPDPIIPGLAGARSARHEGRRARTGADRLGNSGDRRATACRARHSPRDHRLPPGDPGH